MSFIEEQLLETLHHEIPLTKAMGISVTAYEKKESESVLCLSAPLSINANHKDTFFGGSLYTLEVTTGWGLMHLKIKEMGYSGHVVINEGNIKYQRPIASDCISFCEISEDQILRLDRQMKRRGKAVISLDVVLGESRVGSQVLFTGRYAIV